MSDGGSMLDAATKGINANMIPMSGGFFGGDPENMTDQEALNKAGEITKEVDEVDEMQMGGAIPVGFEMSDVYNKLGVTSLGENAGVYDILKTTTSDFANIANIKDIDENQVNTLFTALYFHSKDFKNIVQKDEHKDLIADTILLPTETDPEKQKEHVRKLVMAIGGNDIKVEFIKIVPLTYENALDFINKYILEHPPKLGFGGIKYTDVAKKFNEITDVSKDIGKNIGFDDKLAQMKNNGDIPAETPEEPVVVPTAVVPLNGAEGEREEAEGNGAEAEEEENTNTGIPGVKQSMLPNLSQGGKRSRSRRRKLARN